MFPRARDIKERINKWDLIKIRSFCIAKINSIKIKKEPVRRGDYRNYYKGHMDKIKGEGGGGGERGFRLG